MASRKMVTTLTDDERDFLEIHFYMVCGEECLGFEGNMSALYDFVAQETTAFVTANPSFAHMRGLVEKEFIRLARLQG